MAKNKRWKLTPCPSHTNVKRWRKHYKGKQYYFPRQDGETVAQSHARACQEWEVLKAELTLDSSKQRVEELREEQDALRELPDSHQTRAMWSVFEQLIARHEQLGLKVDSDLQKVLDDLKLAQAEHAGITLDKTGVTLSDTLRSETTIAAAADEFMRYYESQGTSASQLRRTMLCKGRFLKDSGHLPLSRIGEAVESYGRDLQSQLNSGDLSQWSTVGYWQFATKFCRYLYDADKIRELPRTLRLFKFRADTQEVSGVPDEKQCRELLAKCDDEMKLYVLLALNCGMYPKDMSDLTQSQVDWEARTITRKRSKTAKIKNVPTVTHPLWDETFRLLEQFAREEGDRVLTRPNGKPLAKDTTVSSANRVTDKWHKQHSAPVHFKNFRKVVPTLIARDNLESQEIRELFLGHSPKTMEQKHYSAPIDHRLIEVVLQLEQAFVKEQVG